MEHREPTPEPIRNLIEGLKGDRSWRQLTDDCGGSPTRRYLQAAIAEPPEQLPTMAQVEGLSRGLKVHPRVIVQTWGIALGIWDERSWGSAQFHLLDGWGELSISQQQAVARIVAEIRDANRSEPGA